MPITSLSPAQADFSALYWRYLIELKQRPFRRGERRLLEKILDHSYGRGQADVSIANRDDLAASLGSTRNNLQPIIEVLIARDVLGHEERLGTWWIKEIELWRLEADGDRAFRMAQADIRIIAHDKRRREPELIPRDTTDAEVAAEGQQARAAEWPAIGLPPAVALPPSGSAPDPSRSGQENRSEIQNELVLKNRTAVLKFRTSASISDARAPVCVRPGNQVKTDLNIPGNQVQRELPPLDYAGWSLLKELEEFCVAGGDAPFSEKHKRDWTWRARKNPLRLELCLGEMKAHIRERREPRIRSRAGWIKHLWNQEETAETAREFDTPPLDEMGARAREELAKLYHSRPGEIAPTQD